MNIHIQARSKTNSRTLTLPIRFYIEATLSPHTADTFSMRHGTTTHSTLGQCKHAYDSQRRNWHYVFIRGVQWAATKNAKKCAYMHAFETNDKKLYGETNTQHTNTITSTLLCSSSLLKNMRLIKSNATMTTTKTTMSTTKTICSQQSRKPYRCENNKCVPTVHVPNGRFGVHNTQTIYSED